MNNFSSYFNFHSSLFLAILSIYILYKLYNSKIEVPLKIFLKLTRTERIDNVKTSDLRTVESQRVNLLKNVDYHLDVPMVMKIKFRAFKWRPLQRFLRSGVKLLCNAVDVFGYPIRKHHTLRINPEVIAQVNTPRVRDLKCDDMKLFEKGDYAISQTHFINEDCSNWETSIGSNNILFHYNMFKCYKHETRKVPVPRTFPVPRE